MRQPKIRNLQSKLSNLAPSHRVGRVHTVNAGLVHVEGLNDVAAVGDRVQIDLAQPIAGEVIALAERTVSILPEAPVTGISSGVAVQLTRSLRLAPDDSWIGRIIDPNGNPLDGHPLFPGQTVVELKKAAPKAASRNGLGERLETGLAVFNTFLPLVEGQRVGFFSGSGVGKSSLLGELATGVDCDVCVVALIGERGRELRDFVDQTLGAEGLARSIVIAATSDMSPLQRRQSAWTAMAVAEHFREKGLRVLLLADSLTRFAEAHREIALSCGEPASLRGFPPSTSHELMALCERAGPGSLVEGTITAIFTVLVAGSDMEEPIADIVRGVLDGHVVLDRQIAERGRFPAIDALKSVSRSLPGAATDRENDLINKARALLGRYAASEVMVQAGLYQKGVDEILDHAVICQAALDKFISERCGTDQAFEKLEAILAKSAPLSPQNGSVTNGEIPDGSPRSPDV